MGVRLLILLSWVTIQTSLSPVEIRARGVRCLSGGIGCSAMDFSLAKGSGRGDSIFSFEKNRCFGFKAESEPIRKEEFLCLLKIRSIS